MKRTEKQLLDGFRELSETQQSTVLDFVGFLAGRSTDGVVLPPPEPVDMARPEHETVVKAIKRLRATYPMLEPSKLLHDTANQMTRHMVHGTPAVEVIDELERVFRGHYETYLENKS